MVFRKFRQAGLGTGVLCLQQNFVWGDLTLMKHIEKTNKQEKVKKNENVHIFCGAMAGRHFAVTAWQERRKKMLLPRIE